ncbi:hypothetical protein N0B44_32175 [Roseibacterium beibuensis]|uniref:hypothetical protein n=1 Tax=[Roseibacterium] beibuensis TaxID=1193142 RepID=UPI00217E2192|nr:hypothetical protein [Roseibacterium beibuensis]MCS6627571.1 hypothetical protein [Roseibacterium beibuensis]
MRDLRLVWPSRAERWRKPAIVAVSVGLHALVLGYIGWKAFDPPRFYGEQGSLDDPIFPFPVIYAEIEPRPLLRGETARTRETPRPDSPMDSIPDAGTRLNETTGSTGSAAAGDQPSSPSPRALADGAPAPPADVGTAAWQVRPSTMGDRVGRGLRTSPVGCASPRLLTEAERAVCDDRFGARAAAAAPIEGTGNPERDAAFARQGARALAEYEARRRPLAGGTGNVGVQEGPGSNFGMGVAGAHLDPALRPDSTTNVRTRRDRIREAEED